jgi:peptide deformylase
LEAALLTIVKYPDPVLTTRAKPVKDFGPRLAQFVEEMFLTMYQSKGVGLAAPQVGVSQRIYVLNCGKEQPPETELALINPEIVSVEGEQCSEEGCLSFPGIFVQKVRAQKVTMRAQDVNGKWFTVTGEGLMARAFLHELEHLDGKVFLEDIEPAEFVKVRKEVENLRRDYKERMRPKERVIG